MLKDNRISSGDNCVFANWITQIQVMTKYNKLN